MTRLAKKVIQLEDKLRKEYYEYLENLRTCDVNYVISRSYATAILEEITFIPSQLSEDTIDIILKNDFTLLGLYDLWIDSDYNINPDIADAIESELESY